VRLLFLLLIQFVISLIITASVMPIILANTPAAREQPVGVTIACVILIATFAVIWLFWPRRKSEMR
jgi:uncharacterized membrane protein YqjE